MKVTLVLLVLSAFLIAECTRIHRLHHIEQTPTKAHNGLYEQISKRLLKDPEIKAKVDAGQDKSPEFEQLAERKISEIVKGDPSLQSQISSTFGKTSFGKTLSEDERTQMVNWMANHPDVMAADDPTKSFEEVSKAFPEIGKKYNAWLKKNSKRQ